MAHIVSFPRLTISREGAQVRQAASKMTRPIHSSALTTAKEWMDVHNADAKGITRDTPEVGVSHCVPTF
jgi:hypothetical protein